MKNLIYILLLASLNINAQNKWSIGVEYNPGFSYRKLDVTGELYKKFNFTDSDGFVPRYATYTSLRLKYQFHKKWTIESGLSYIVRGCRMPDLIYSDMLEGPDGKRINKPLPSKSEEGEFLYAFRFLQVPANINYNISLKERSALMITAGASLDILLHAYGITKIKVEGEPLQVTKTQPEDKYYHRINYSTYFSVGYQYQLNKKISIKANPYYSINIRYMDKNVGYRARYYNYGVGLGVYYNL